MSSVSSLSIMSPSLSFVVFICLALSMALAAATTPQPKVYRDKGHFYGPNMTLPKGFQNMGSVNVEG